MPTKLEQLQLQFRQKLMQEKEERMIKIHTDSQQKALNKVLRYDASGPATSHQASLSSQVAPTIVRKPSNITATQNHTSPVKKSSPGVDRSRPLPPINRNGGHVTRNNVSAFSGESSSHSHSSSSSTSSSARMSPTAHATTNNFSGVRSRSVDADNDRAITKPSVKVKQQRTDYITESSKYQVQHGYQMNNHNTYDRKSPEAEISRPKQPDIQRPKVKVSYETPSKVSNGHTMSFKSSTEQRTMAGNGTSSNGRAVQIPSTTIVQNRKTKTTVHVISRKPVNGTTSQSRNTGASNAAISRNPPNPNQEQCRHCGRNFNKDRIEKHSTICLKTSQKKVKVFDVTKMRVKGTEAESFVKKGVQQRNTPKAKKTNWKKQHEDFINTIRQAKIAQRHLAAGGKLSDLPPPPPSDTSSYVPCPYCGRKFDEGVAQRHIPKCKNILSNKKMPTKKK